MGGCISSKIFKKKLKSDIIVYNGGDYLNHVVSLTSTTYGLLNLDADPKSIQFFPEPTKISPPLYEFEVINAWELMAGLDDGTPTSNRRRESPNPNPRAFLRDLDRTSPSKFFNQIGTPKKSIRSSGKENRGRLNNSSRFSPKSALKLIVPVRNTLGSDSGRFPGLFPSRRRNSDPLFDPEFVALYEKQLNEEEEELIKRIVSERLKSEREATAVVIYTTTLRGIRKTFEDCNKVRSIVESYGVRLIERDVSMDSGFREELRALTGSKEVKVPAVFVKGRLIGGAAEVLKLEEEDKLEALFEGIPAVAGGGGCDGCGGVRFVMCGDCNGSCKVLDETTKKKKKKTMKCGQCNENGLVHCPICSSNFL